MAHIDSKKWLEKLKLEGFTDLRVCPMPPAEDFPQHTHDVHTVHVLLKGDLAITDKNITKVYKVGERIDFPAGTVHKARGSINNGEMIVGVKNEISKS